MLLGLLLLPGPAVAAGGLSLPEAPVAVGHGAEGPVYDFLPLDPSGRGRLEVLPGVVLHLRPDAPPPRRGHSLGGRSWYLPLGSGHEAVAEAQRWRRDPRIEAAWPDLLLPRQTASLPHDDPDRGGQWYLDELGMDALYAVSEGDPAVRIAVLDSGIDIAHVDLLEGIAEPYDAFSDDEDPSPDPGEFCASAGTQICDEHGTAVSGVVGARAGNGANIVGLCPSCTLVPVKLLGESGGAMSRDIAAFEHAIAADAGVINNSWGYTRSIPVPDTLAAVIERATTEPRDGLGALVVFAAGNDDREIADDELQALPTVLCVSATDSYGNPTNYTNSGASVDIAAPSATVALGPGDETITTFGGTSAAAPVVSGLAGWVLSMDPSLSAAEVHQLLVETAIPSPLVTHDEHGHHPVYGFGEIDPAGLLAAFEEGGSDSAGAGGGGEDPACGCGSGGAAAVLLPLLLWGQGRRREASSPEVDSSAAPGHLDPERERPLRAGHAGEPS